MIVLDAGAFIASVGSVGVPALRRRLASVTNAHVPDVFDTEVANVVRHRHLAGRFDDIAVAGILSDLRAVPITRHPALAMLDDMWALHDNVSMYDAAYVALAARLRLPLVTIDGALARAPGLPCRVELF